ncbi:channel accessory protein ArfC [Mycolicibacterium brumae]|uniref:Sensor domain-containing protein n=1 Tax=Mycolicibacterium brumae TaxID=85968 RepID=A0A2G5PF44_9MYCO|nr:sensor domain-containing protein [Mycolicibacterium brumae]MCV7191640.1 sensor domain-containing protein [Mycolicibacterium brumae]PIB76938.1 sensor domain-containing protein [Mycolicibacterium brumae]UWW07604.1 sensor domain-containing protein [Mycolicibacterium brumae]
MADVNWYLMLLAFLLGALITVAAMLRQVHVRAGVPVTAEDTTEVLAVAATEQVDDHAAKTTEKIEVLKVPAATASVPEASVVRPKVWIVGAAVGALLAAWVGSAALRAGDVSAAEATETQPAPPILASMAMLPGETAVSDLVGSSSKLEGPTVAGLPPGGASTAIDDPECNPVWVPSLQASYRDSGYIRAVSRILQNKETPAPTVVYDGLISFPDRAAAEQVYQRQLGLWQTCAGRTVATGPVQFSFGEVTDVDGVASMRQQAVGNPRYGCDRAMKVQNNIIIDVKVCRTDVSGQGVDLANADAADIPN